MISFVVVYDINGDIVANITSPPYSFLSQGRGHKSKTTKLIACGIISTWGSAQESEP